MLFRQKGESICEGRKCLSHFTGSEVVKDLTGYAEDTRAVGSIPELGRCPGVVNGILLQYFCLENLIDRGAWWATVHEGL